MGCEALKVLVGKSRGLAFPRRAPHPDVSISLNEKFAVSESLSKWASSFLSAIGLSASQNRRLSLSSGMRTNQPALLKAVMCRSAVVCGARDPMQAEVTELREPDFSRI